jgi:hypothetical protein
VEVLGGTTATTDGEEAGGEAAGEAAGEVADDAVEDPDVGGGATRVGGSAKKSAGTDAPRRSGVSGSGVSGSGVSGSGVSGSAKSAEGSGSEDAAKKAKKAKKAPAGDRSGKAGSEERAGRGDGVRDDRKPTKDNVRRPGGSADPGGGFSATTPDRTESVAV